MNAVRVLTHARKWLAQATLMLLLATLSCGGGGGGEQSAATNSTTVTVGPLSTTSLPPTTVGPTTTTGGSLTTTFPPSTTVGSTTTLPSTTVGPTTTIDAPTTTTSPPPTTVRPTTTTTPPSTTVRPTTTIGGPPSPEPPTIVACTIEGVPVDCFQKVMFILNTTTPTAEFLFSKPMRPETAQDNVLVCAEDLVDGPAVEASLGVAQNEGIAEVEWLDGNTRLRVTVLGNQEVSLFHGALVGAIVTINAGVLSEDGGQLAAGEIGPLVFEVDLTAPGGPVTDGAVDLFLCPIVIPNP